MQHRISDGAILDRGIGKDGIHHQDVLHEPEIRVVIGDITERNQRCEKAIAATKAVLLKRVTIMEIPFPE